MQLFHLGPACLLEDKYVWHEHVVTLDHVEMDGEILDSRYLTKVEHWRVEAVCSIDIL